MTAFGVLTNSLVPCEQLFLTLPFQHPNRTIRLRFFDSLPVSFGCGLAISGGRGG